MLRAPQGVLCLPWPLIYSHCFNNLSASFRRDRKKQEEWICNNNSKQRYRFQLYSQAHWQNWDLLILYPWCFSLASRTEKSIRIYFSAGGTSHAELGHYSISPPPLLSPDIWHLIHILLNLSRQHQVSITPRTTHLMAEYSLSTADPTEQKLHYVPESTQSKVVTVTATSVMTQINIKHI